jgi:hypothetical protein
MKRREPVSTSGRFGEGIDDHECGLPAARDEPLVPVEYEHIAVGHGGGPDGTGVGSGKWLGKRVAAEPLLIGEQREIFLLLRVGAVARNGIADQRVVNSDDGCE